MKTKKTLFAVTALSSALFMAGCSSIPKEVHEQQLAEQRSQYEQQIQQLEAEKSSALSQANAAEAKTEQYSALAQQSSTANTGASDLFPPNAKPGQCWSRVLTPATFKTNSSQVLATPESQSISIIPAKYENATERLLVKEATTRIVPVAATYKTVTETVEIKPAQTVLKKVPAVYETVSERVLVKAAHTVWKRGAGFQSSALQTRIDNGTGEIMCLVEVPATYKTVTKRVLKTPERVVEQQIPAKYQKVSKRVVDTPATTKTVTIPAEYKNVVVKREVSPAKTTSKVIPATYKTVTSREKITDEELKWAEVLCEDNMTPKTVASLQELLRKSGTYNGPIDGQYGPLTERAANTYAKRNGLPTGSRLISLETAQHIGLKI
ncbi:MAG: peptidoglycan-binding protein [Cellvibrionaceae bacterium]